MSKSDKHIKDLSDSFEEMFETAEAVKGESFTHMVGYMVNAQSLLKIMQLVAQESIEEGKYVLINEKHPMRAMIARILDQGVSMYGDALGLTMEQMQEAAKFAEAMRDKINHAEDLVEGEDE